ncbi:type-1 angiotensin II receptor [Salminus brasiliensis]|uniref:type-1 angiotensin II receptor n=1 Tax=Salminus brasiliensis TaxID=930266 RepID=UPI003B83344F
MENLTGLELTCNLTKHGFIFTLIPLVYSCNFLLGVVGNSMVVAVIYYRLKLKTVANVFVLNLALSDLTFLVTLPMWAAYTALGYDWPFGDFLCKAAAGLAFFTLYASVFFLTALSVDRYLAIVRPVESRQCRTVAYAWSVCALVWLLAFVLSLPIAYIRKTHFIKHANVTVCGLLDAEHESLLAALSLMKAVLGFILPLLVILTCYSLIGRALLEAGHVRKSSGMQGDEVFRMLAAAVLSFFLCWAPHQVLGFMEALLTLKKIRACTVVAVIDTAMPFAICVAFFNSCMNPILYGFVGKNFRRSLLKLLRCSSGSSTLSHPTLSTRMSTLSCRASEPVQNTDRRTTPLPQEPDT